MWTTGAIRQAAAFGALLPIVFGIGGCATLDPRADYDRAEALIAQSSQAPEVYRPEDDALAKTKTEALLADGLGVQESVQIALLNNPRFQGAMAAIGMARADLVQSELWSNPVLGIGALLPSDGGGLVNLQLDLAQNIAELWQIRPRRRAAAAHLESAILEVARRAVALATEAKSAYYEAVGAAEVSQSASDNLANVRLVLDAAVARRDAGAGTDLDVNLAQELVLEAELSEISAQLAAADARRQLAILLGLTTPADELALIDPLPADAPAVHDSEELIQQARGHRLDLQIARQRAVAAANQYQLELRRVFPNLELGLSFERDERRGSHEPNVYKQTAAAAIASNRVTGPQLGLPRDADDDQTYILGPTVSLELPIFDHNQAQIAKAQFAYVEAMKSYQAVDQALVQEVRGAAERASTARRIVKLYQDRSLPLAEKNLKLARDAYESGRTPFLNVLEAQRFYLQARTKYIEGLTAVATAIPELEMQVGRALIETPSSRPASRTGSLDKR